ncbi:MAG: DUF2288 family protein, partial [Halothiobacillaceae bacterium]|nr:DUF2288 family protein [Halothiobacillaceae bacterium]
MRKGFSDEAAHLEELHARLNGETACVAWAELERFHARGILVHVRAGLDLVDVAARFAQDDAFSVSRWMEAGLISRLDDAQARDWLGRDPSL